MRRNFAPLILFLLVILTPVNALESVTIFSDNFEDGNADGWELGTGWQIKTDDGNYVLANNLHSFARVAGLGKVAFFESKVKLLKGSVHLNMRENLELQYTRYLIGLGENYVYLQKEIGQNFSFFKRVEANIGLNRWHNVKIEVNNQTIKVFLDGELILTSFDVTPIESGGISLETLDDSEAYFDDVKVGIFGEPQKEIPHPFVNGKHFGDIEITGSNIMVIENGYFEQFGNIYVKDYAKLVIRNSSLKIERYQKQLWHWGIRVSDRAYLDIENSSIFPGEMTLATVEISGRGKVNITDSPTSIHLIGLDDSSQLTIKNSRVVFDIGGSIVLGANSDVEIINSTIGSIALSILRGSNFEAQGLGTGFFKSWNLHKDLKISGISYNLTLINTTLIEDTLGVGPFERGWVIIVHPDSTAKIVDSELRKVIIVANDESLYIENLKPETPSNFTYKNIELENVIVKGQWAIHLYNSTAVVNNSEAFWASLHGNSNLTVIDTTINELGARDFFGTINFKNTKCAVGGLDFNNNFTIAGDVVMTGEPRGIGWYNSTVRRIYNVLVLDEKGKPVEGAVIEINDGKNITNYLGKATFDLVFSDDDHLEDRLLKVTIGKEQIETKVNFVTTSPIVVKFEVSEPSGFLSAVLLIIITISVIGIVILFLKRRMSTSQNKLLPE